MSLAERLVTQNNIRIGYQPTQRLKPIRGGSGELSEQEIQERAEMLKRAFQATPAKPKKDKPEVNNLPIARNYQVLKDQPEKTSGFKRFLNKLTDPLKKAKDSLPELKQNPMAFITPERGSKRWKIRNSLLATAGTIAIAAAGFVALKGGEKNPTEIYKDAVNIQNPTSAAVSTIFPEQKPSQTEFKPVVVTSAPVIITREEFDQKITENFEKQQPTAVNQIEHAAPVIESPVANYIDKLTQEPPKQTLAPQLPISSLAEIKSYEVVQLRPGDTIWDLAREHLIRKNKRVPTNAEILVTAKRICQEEGITVEEWGIKGHVSDRALPVGLSVVISS